MIFLNPCYTKMLK